MKEEIPENIQVHCKPGAEKSDKVSNSRSDALLLLCPFCGGKPYWYDIEPHTHSMATFMPDCDGETCIECSCGCGLIDATFEKVAARWNKRA